MLDFNTGFVRAVSYSPNVHVAKAYVTTNASIPMSAHSMNAQYYTDLLTKILN